MSGKPERCPDCGRVTGIELGEDGRWHCLWKDCRAAWLSGSNLGILKKPIVFKTTMPMFKERGQCPYCGRLANGLEKDGYFHCEDCRAVWLPAADGNRLSEQRPKDDSEDSLDINT